MQLVWLLADGVGVCFFAKGEGMRAGRNASSGDVGGCQVAHDKVFQQRQLAVEKMLHVGHNGHGQALGTSPVEHRCQRYGVVVLAMYDQGATVRGTGQRGAAKTAGCSANESDFVDTPTVPQAFDGVGNDESSKGKTRKCQRFICGCGLCDDGQGIFEFATACVVLTSASAHATKVKAHGSPAALYEGTRQGLHDFVVHGAAKQRVGMSDEGSAAWQWCGIGGGGQVQQGFNEASATVQGQGLSLSIHGVGIVGLKPLLRT